LIKKICLLLLLVSSVSYSQKNFPNFTVDDIGGKKLDLNKLSTDNILLISFWATWCNPCIDELDTFNTIQDSLKNVYHTKHIAISIDDSRSYSRVVPMVKGKNWDFDVAIDINQKSKRLLNIMVIPHTILVYKNKIVYEHSGFVEGDENQIINKLKVLNEQ
jgi:thiol-disulfide isomerase/thioredoxin